MKLPHWITNLLFPPKCVLCGRLLDKIETDLCGTCRRETDQYRPGKEKISFVACCTVLWYYKENVRSSLLRYKFSGRRSYSAAYARLLAMKLQESELAFDLITWVPIHPSKKRRRGYDQVELIALALSEELEIPAVRTLKKIRKNKTQSTVHGTAQRKANVLGVYAPVNPECFQGKRVLLLDDIITTGSTMRECARILVTYGTDTVLGAAIAARPPSKNNR